MHDVGFVSLFLTERAEKITNCSVIMYIDVFIYSYMNIHIYMNKRSTITMHARNAHGGCSYNHHHHHHHHRSVRRWKLFEHTSLFLRSVQFSSVQFHTDTIIRYSSLSYYVTLP